MKSSLRWMSKIFLFGLIVLSMLFLWGCADSSDDSNPFANTDDTYSHIYPEDENAAAVYVYVNNDSYASQNYISAFEINNDGTLKELTGSPYATDGAGGGTSFANNMIALAPDKRLLFASNVGDNTITAFSINNNDGTLTIIGSPVSSGGSMGGSGSLVVSNDENYLFVANDDTNSISVFTISSTGGLTPVTGSPFNIGGGADGMTLNLSGNILYVANPDNNTLIALNVASNGSLSPIAGSPFAYTADSSPITSFALSSSTIGIAGAAAGFLSSYSIDAIGAPTLLNVLNTGVVNSQAVTTARNGSIAILSGGARNRISVVNVAANGSLMQVAGSPFATAADTTGYAVANPEGTFLYATEGNQLEGFSIGANGALISLGIFPITNAGDAPGIVIYAP